MTNRPALVCAPRRPPHPVWRRASRPGFVDREFASYSDRVLAKFKEALR